MLQNFGFCEIMIILVIVLLLFGAKRIPEIAGSLGKGINEFKRNVSDAQRLVRTTSNRVPRPKFDTTTTCLSQSG